MALVLERDTLALSTALDADLEVGMRDGISNSAGTQQFAPVPNYSSIAIAARNNGRHLAVGSLAMVVNQIRNYDPVRIPVTNWSNGFLPYTSSGTTYSNGVASYYKNMAGECCLEGLILVPGTFSGNQVVCFIDSQYAPQSGHIFPAIGWSGAANVLMQVVIDNLGNLALIGATSVQNQWVSLDGIRWRASTTTPTYGLP